MNYLVWREDGRFMGLMDVEDALSYKKRGGTIINEPCVRSMGRFPFPVDWDMLHKQKASLLAVISVLEENDSLFDGLEGFVYPIPSAGEACKDLTGILHLIDALQDHAVYDLGIWQFP